MPISQTAIMVTRIRNNPPTLQAEILFTCTVLPQVKIISATSEHQVLVAADLCEGGGQRPPHFTDKKPFLYHSWCGWRHRPSVLLFQNLTPATNAAVQNSEAGNSNRSESPPTSEWQWRARHLSFYFEARQLSHAALMNGASPIISPEKSEN